MRGENGSWLTKSSSFVPTLMSDFSCVEVFLNVEFQL